MGDAIGRLHPEPGSARHAGPSRHRRGARRRGVAQRIDRGSARDRGEREQGARPIRARDFELPVSRRSRDREPRARGPAEGGRALRPADRARAPGCFGPGLAPGVAGLRVLRRAVVDGRAATRAWCIAGRVSGRACRQPRRRPERQCRGGCARAQCARRRRLASRGGVRARVGRPFARVRAHAEQCPRCAVLPRSERRARAGECVARARGRCGGSTQLAHDRASGLGQKHARASAAGHPASDDGSRSAADCIASLGQHARVLALGLGAPSVPRSASHSFGRCDGGRQLTAASGRGFAGAQRAAVSGRVAGVSAARTGGAARAAGDRDDRRSRVARGRPSFPPSFRWSRR